MKFVTTDLSSIEGAGEVIAQIAEANSQLGYGIVSLDSITPGGKYIIVIPTESPELLLFGLENSPVSIVSSLGTIYIIANDTEVMKKGIDFTLTFTEDIIASDVIYVYRNGEFVVAVNDNCVPKDKLPNIFAGGHVVYLGSTYVDSCVDNINYESYCHNDTLITEETSCADLGTSCNPTQISCIEPVAGEVTSNTVEGFRNELILENNSDVVKIMIGQIATIDSWAAVEIAGHKEFNLHTTITDEENCNGNRILIGGNCVNTCSAQALGLSNDPSVCGSQFDNLYPNGLIALVENQEGKSLVIAGSTFENTMEIAKALNNGIDFTNFVSNINGSINVTPPYTNGSSSNSGTMPSFMSNIFGARY